jgi:hypothetical protein
MQLRLMGTASQTSYWDIGREAMSTGQFRFIASRKGSIIIPMVIDDQTGNVGIGTTSPTATLQVSNTSSGNAFSMIGSNSKEFVNIAYLGYIRTRASDTNGANMHFVDNGNTKRMEMAVNASSMTWYSDALTSEFLYFQHSSGNIGINIATPAQKLHVSGAIAQTLGSATTTHFVGVTGSLTTNTVIASVDVATQPAYAVFFDYVVYDDTDPPTNARAGSIMTVNNNSTSRYTDTSTSDIGDTTPVDFSTSISGNNLLLTANIASGTWFVNLNYRRF